MNGIINDGMKVMLHVGQRGQHHSSVALPHMMTMIVTQDAKAVGSKIIRELDVLCFRPSVARCNDDEGSICRKILGPGIMAEDDALSMLVAALKELRGDGWIFS